MPSIETTVAKFRGLRCTSIAAGLPDLLAAAETNEVSYLEFADMLVEHERRQRNHKRILRNRKAAGFPTIKRLEEFDYRYQTTITKRQVNALLDFSFIDNRENLIFIGPRAWARPTWPSASATRPSRPATRSSSPGPPNWWSRSTWPWPRASSRPG
ncbi:hypothetical protein GF1_06400 [Desulfolithobacter dissulfuricans]|uniref:IstB-like ATP-binding domain-containing protein n=1 Tax=Desulfolithobacter dissulfuricans TaxID=2795293 RepID=A0A915TYS5_9BACT|nr:hypothetical protein GF1_06400 [Desulfolithobacter dissulfuricans]